MGKSECAKEIADAIQAALCKPGCAGFTVSKRGGCAACDPGSCFVCGYLFTGEVFQIDHPTLGRRVLSDKAIHYLGHGIHRYQTGYVVRGEPVVVDLDLEELAAYVTV